MNYYSHLLVSLVSINILFAINVSDIRAESIHDDVDPLEISNSITLKDVIEQTYARDPRAELVENYQNNASAYRQLASRPYSAPLSLNVHYQSDRPISDQGLREWEADMNIPLWRWNQRSATKAVGKSYEEYSLAHAAILRLEVAGQVRELLWNLELAREIKNLAKQALDEAQELESDVAARERAGDLAEIDLLMAHNESLAKKLDYVTQNMEYLHVAEQYVGLTGLTIRPESFSEKQVESPDSYSEHPLMREIQARIARSQKQLDQLRTSKGQPVSLSIGARNEKGSATDTSITSVGVGINIPFDTNNFQRPMLIQAQTSLAELFAELKKLERFLDLQTHGAEHELETITKQLEVASQQQANARENLRMARAAFRAGELDVSQLLRVHIQMVTADQQLVIRQVEEKQAIARINQAWGVLP